MSESRNYISQMQLPDGNNYYLKDLEAREMIAQGVKILIVQQLPEASSGTMGTFYFVSQGTGGTAPDSYDEFVTIDLGEGQDPRYEWEKVGNAHLDLSDYTTYSHTHNVTSTKKYLHKEDVIKSLGTRTVPSGVSTSKLKTSSLYAVQSGTTTASYATSASTVNVATTGTTKSIPNVTGNTTGSVTITPTTASGTSVTYLGAETSGRTDNSPMWGTSVSGETLSFTFKPIETNSVMVSATASTTATKTDLGTAISVTPAVANGSITTYTFSNVTVPIKNSNATQFATGQLQVDDANGATIATGSAGDATVVTGGTTASVYSTLNTSSASGDTVITAVSSPTGQANQ